jgi:hypothetical protein
MLSRNTNKMIKSSNKIINFNKPFRFYSDRPKRLNLSEFTESKDIMIRRLKRNCEVDEQGFYILFDSKLQIKTNYVFLAANISMYLLMSSFLLLFIDKEFNLKLVSKKENEQIEKIEK